MIIQEVYIDENNEKHEHLIRSYSNNKKLIRQLETGVEYSEAIDCLPLRYTYIETDKDIPVEETEVANELENLE